MYIYKLCGVGNVRVKKQPLDTLEFCEYYLPQAEGELCLCVYLCGSRVALPSGGGSSVGSSPLRWSPADGGPPLSCSCFPWHLFLALPLACALALAVIALGL